MIDQKRLIGEVAAKNGIRLEPDDPAFALVTLNEIVLQDTVAALTHEIRSSLQSFAESLAKTENRAGKVLAHDVKVAAAELRRELNSDIENASLKAHELVTKVSAVNSRPVMVRWLATGSLVALLLFLCGVVVGRTILEH
jgi:hypothetical protein